MQRISDKSRDTLWDAVESDIIVARAKIGILLASQDPFIIDTVDSVLHNLSSGVPQKAIDCFNYNKER